MPLDLVLVHTSWIGSMTRRDVECIKLFVLSEVGIGRLFQSSDRLLHANDMVFYILKASLGSMYKARARPSRREKNKRGESMRRSFYGCKYTENQLSRSRIAGSN